MIVGAFPIDAEMMNKFKSMYEAGRNLMVMFLPAFVSIRVIINFISAKGNDEYANILRDLVVACFLLASFMLLIQGILEIPEMFGSLLKEYATYELNIDLKSEGWLSVLENPLYLLVIFCYYCCYLLYFILLALVCGFGSYIIIAGTMFQSYWILKATFWLLVVLGSWPIIWYTLNLFTHILSKDANSISGLIIAGIMSVAKFLTPIVALAKTMNAGPIGAAKSGVTSLAGKAMTAVAPVKSAAAFVGKSKMANGMKEKLTSGAQKSTSFGKAALSVGADKTISTAKKMVPDSVKTASANTIRPITAVAQKMNAIKGMSANTVRDVFSQRTSDRGQKIAFSSPVVQKTVGKIAPSVVQKAQINYDQKQHAKPKVDSVSKEQLPHSNNTNTIDVGPSGYRKLNTDKKQLQFNSGKKSKRKNKF